MRAPIGPAPMTRAGAPRRISERVIAWRATARGSASAAVRRSMPVRHRPDVVGTTDRRGWRTPRPTPRPWCPGPSTGTATRPDMPRTRRTAATVPPAPGHRWRRRRRARRPRPRHRSTRDRARRRDGPIPRRSGAGRCRTRRSTRRLIVTSSGPGWAEGAVLDRDRAPFPVDRGRHGCRQFVAHSLLSHEVFGQFGSGPARPPAAGSMTTARPGRSEGRRSRPRPGTASRRGPPARGRGRGVVRPPAVRSRRRAPGAAPGTRRP